MRTSAARDPLLTVEDAAAQLGLGTGTLRNRVSMRRVGYVKVGRLTRIPQSEVDRFIAEHTVSAREDQ